MPKDVDMDVSRYTIGDGWDMDLPHCYALRDTTETIKYGDIKVKTQFFSGIFIDIDGVVHSYAEMQELTTDQDTYEATFVSDIPSDNGDPINYRRFYEDRTLEDGTVYNFLAYDQQTHLKYYMYFSTAVFAGSQRGVVVRIEDDYGNTIKYNHVTPQNGGFSVYITDTYGREVHVSTSGITYTDDNGTEQNIVYRRSTLQPEELDNNSLMKGKTVNRLTVVNQAGEETHYDSRSAMIFGVYTAGNYFSSGRPASLPTGAMDTATGYNLERIVYPTGMEKHYDYVDIYQRYSQGLIMRMMYAVSSTYEKNGDSIVNKNNYALSGDTLRTIEAVRDGDGRYFVKSFDTKGRLTEEYVKSSSSSRILNGAKYTYNNNDGIQTKTVYNDSVSSSYTYGYKRRGLVSSVADDYGKISYSYYENTRIPQTITSSYTGASYKILNTFTDDHLSIASTTVNVGNVEKSKSVYDYDDEGNLISEKVWLTDKSEDNALGNSDEHAFFSRRTTVGENKALTVADTAHSVYDADGKSTGDSTVEYKFNVFGSPLQQTDPYGNVTTIAYDSVNRPVSYTFPNNTQRLVDYSPEDRRIILTDEEGIRYKYTYNSLGMETGKYIFYNGFWEPVYVKEYDTTGGRLCKLISYTAVGTGIETQYTYDFMDRPATETAYSFKAGEEPVLLYTSSTTYTKSSTYRYETTVTVRDGFEITTTKEYAAYDRLMSETVSDGTETHSVSYTYDSKGRPEIVTDSKGNTTITDYNYNDKPVSVTDALGNVVSYTYDCLGRQVSSTDAKGNISYMFYDSLDRLVKTQTPFMGEGSAVSKKYYDKNSRVIKECTDYTTTEYSYDSMGNLTGVLFENGSNDNAVGYSYTPTGKVSEMITGLDLLNGSLLNGATTSYTYNSYGQLERVTDPLGKSVEYSYDYLGNQLTSYDRNGTVFENTYGAFGVEAVSAENGDKVQTLVNTYDSLGNITSRSLYNGAVNESTVQYAYDAFSRLVSENDGNMLKSYTYDELSNLTAYKLSGNGEIKDSLAYSYDELNRLIAIDNGDTTTSYTYDVNGNILTKASGDFLTEYEYNAGNMLIELRNKHSDTLISGYSYKYRRDGNRVAELSSDGQAKYYTYDGLGRLQTELHKNADGTEINRFGYTYDRYGNRISLTHNGKKTAYEYDLNNRLISSANSNGGMYYNYDENGNQILSRGFTLSAENEGGVNIKSDYTDYTVREYDLFNRLVYVNNGGTDICNYSYYADGLRKSKTINGATTTYSWNNGNMVAETTSDGTAIYEYDLQGVLRRIKDGSSSYYLKNAHGDVTGLYSETGEAITEYIYDAFGSQLNTNEADTNPFRYCGEYTDLSSGLIYLRNRYYDPSIGRFISEDPIRHGTNWYIYANNNPVMFVDPTGLIPSLEDAAEMASRSYNTYDMSRSGLESRKLGDGWRLIDEWKGSEGLVIHIYVRGDGEHSSYTGAKEYAFVNKGSSTWGDWANNLQQPFGWSTDMVESIAKAEYFANGDWGNYEITFIGHSKGGAEAAANAVATNRSAILFNPAATALNEYGLNANTYSADMTVYVVKGEPLNALNSLLGAKVIDNYETLPFYSWNPIKNHSMEAIKSGVKGR